MMKNMVVALLVCSFLQPNLSAKNKEDTYQELIIENVDALDAVESQSQVKLLHRKFASISARYPKQWIPQYYSAVTDIYPIIYNFLGHTEVEVLEDIKSKISDLSAMDGADLSEVYTLWAFYYIGVIVSNIPENGPKYYQTVINYSDQAMKQNSANPRPILLLAVFEQYLPESLRSGRDFCQEVSKAEYLFEKENASAHKVYFGKGLLSFFKRDCN